MVNYKLCPICKKNKLPISWVCSDGMVVRKGCCEECENAKH